MIQIKKESIEAAHKSWKDIIHPKDDDEFYIHYWIDKEGNIKETMYSPTYTEDLIISFDNDQILDSDKWEII